MMSKFIFVWANREICLIFTINVKAEINKPLLLLAAIKFISIVFTLPNFLGLFRCKIDTKFSLRFKIIDEKEIH